MGAEKTKLADRILHPCQIARTFVFFVEIEGAFFPGGGQPRSVGLAALAILYRRPPSFCDKILQYFLPVTIVASGSGSSLELKSEPTGGTPGE